MVAGQLGAGVGNLVFTLVMARVLAPEAFARLATFLALYLLINLPMASISAAAALDPDRAVDLRRKLFLASLGLGVAVLLASPFLATLLHLPVGLALILGVATPCAGPLALERGRLYGRSRYRRIIVSMAAEPALRLSAGVALAVTLGPEGAAIGVVVAGYAALEVARRGVWRASPVPSWATAALTDAAALPEVTVPDDLSGLDLADPSPGAPVALARAVWTAGAFLLLAVVQNQDLLFANRLLPPSQAGAYGALSTLGGAAAFATATIPLVLLPRVVEGRRHAMAAALAAAGALGTVAVTIAALIPNLLTGALFGAQYATIAPLAALYVGAMALLGISRVLIAHLCATTVPRAGVVLLVAVAAGQAVGISLFGHSVAEIATTTLASTATLTVALGTAAVVRMPATRHKASLALGVLTRPVALTVLGLFIVGFGLRLIIARGIWIDEATSIHDAALPFWQMIMNLRDSDVHPPLYFAILWTTVHLTGSTAQLIVRLPGIIFGALIVPTSYLTAKDLWDRRTGVVAATLCTGAPLLVWYSQEARMYSLFMLLALVAVWAQVMALRTAKTRYWLVYALSSAGLGWTEYFGLLQVATQQLFFVGWLWQRRHEGGPEIRRALIGWTISGAAILALLAPLVPFVTHQFLVNQSLGKGFGSQPSQIAPNGTGALSFYVVLANLVWAIWGYHSTPTMAALVAMWPVGILSVLFALGRRRQWTTSLVIACIAIPSLILIVVGSLKPDLFDIRYLSGAVVLILILLARVLTGSVRSTVLLRAGAAMLVVSLALGLYDEQVNGANPRRYDFRSALHLVDARYRAGNLLIYDPKSLALVVAYYSPKVRAENAAVGDGVIPAGDKLFVMASPQLMHTSDQSTLAIDLQRLEARNVLVDMIKRANVTVWEFAP